ncbi:hypothetical protein H0I31_02160 [Tenacibaculum sp. AHE15PA]|uniref:hypothetical protein n=1 Tax=unclassified Tenacibaculum TaxID=2635139 RepID=UPI001C4FDF30|nr:MULTISPECIES: hypothetical protein [unclassified Tenacibaculum]QXP72526.1 hypothetical protein H0I30_07415 [Tenacibaculum sp. AHE14PA]QXP76441.1 hypothetical protein H0I31_02160 [Tenacibaculum sp. AHE15PA]
MSKQQKTYLLLAGVLAVWGVIGYQIFSQLSPTENILPVKSENLKYVPKLKIEQEKYFVKANYRDPFLGKLYATKKRKVKKITPQKETIPFPSVTYNGIIEGAQKKSYIITVNGKQEILKINQTFESITLLQANSKEAKIKFKGVIKRISIQ